MNSRLVKLMACGLVAAPLALAPRAEALPKIFGKKTSDAPPGASQLADQEARAMQQLTAASELQTAGKDAAAAKAYLKIVADYPFTRTASTAQFRAGELHEKMAKPGKAFESYQTLIERYPQSSEYTTALERQFTIVTDLRANPGGFLGFGKRTTDDLVEMYEKVISNGSRTVYAPKAQFAIGELYATRNDLGDAEKSTAAFQKVVDTWPDSPEAREAALKTGRVLQSMAENTRDATNLTRAQEQFESSLALFPDGPQAAEAQQALTQLSDLEADKSFRIGQFYEKKGNLKAAVIYYNEVLRAPGSARFVDARERLSDLSSRDPKLLDSMPGVKVAQTDLAVPAKTDTKSRPDYFGPPAPVERTRKPQMRVDDSIPFTPIEEPALPTKTDGSPMTEDLLLPPPPGAKPADTPPVPAEPMPEVTPPAPEPAPAEPAPAPVPEAPADAPSLPAPAAPPAGS